LRRTSWTLIETADPFTWVLPPMGWGHSARGNGSLQRIIRWGCRNIYAEFAVRNNGFIGSSKIGTMLLI
jgi:hypothetical protein